MRTMTEITPAEQADRLAIRQLVDAYAHCADRRLVEEQKSLVTEDTHFVVYLNGEGSEPTQVVDGREGLTPVFGGSRRLSGHGYVRVTIAHAGHASCSPLGLG
jgi:hypothetical protein